MTEKEPLSLKNDGQLQVFFIGVGSAFSNRHHQTNFLLIKGDHHIMVDFGMTGPLALKETAGLNPIDIECILPTHSHADHVGGIECLGLMNRYVGMKFMEKPMLKCIITEEYQRVLWDQALRGGMSWNEDALERAQSFGDFFEVIRPKWKTQQPRETYELDYGPIHLEIFRTNHIPEMSNHWQASFLSYGLFVDDRIFISVDTKFDLELINMYCDRSEVMFHDCQFFPGAVHAPLDDLKQLMPSVKDKMVLMHIADNFDQQDISDFPLGFAKQGHLYTF